jgi:hypothetical protein
MHSLELTTRPTGVRNSLSRYLAVCRGAALAMRGMITTP